MMENETIRADPTLRRRLLWAMAAAAVAASLYFAWLFGEIEQVSASQEPDLSGLIGQLRWMSLGLLAGAAGLCLYLCVLAIRVFRGGRFPPPGTRVIRDTRVRTGTQARIIAVLAVVLGCALVVLAAATYGVVGHFIEAEALL